MMAAKDTSVDGLTKGVEFLFKKNKVEYIRGTASFTGEHEVKVNKVEGGSKRFWRKTSSLPPAAKQRHSQAST